MSSKSRSPRSAKTEAEADTGRKRSLLPLDAPWLQPVWQDLLRLRDAWPQALLLSGPAGIGKATLAWALARAWLCEQSLASGAACGQCEACHWLEPGLESAHPDFRWLQPGQDDGSPGHYILLAAVRELVAFANLTSHRGGRRVVVIEPGEAMHPNAANALLKILEEPPAGVHFLVLSHAPGRLLPTIRSRLRPYRVPSPTPAQARHWVQTAMPAAAIDANTLLAWAGGAPERARQLVEQGVLTVREQLQQTLLQGRALDSWGWLETVDETHGPHLLEGMLQWGLDLLWVQHGLPPRAHPNLGALSKIQLPAAQQYELLAWCQAVQQALREHQHPLNQRLQIAALLQRYACLMAEVPAAR